MHHRPAPSAHAPRRAARLIGRVIAPVAVLALVGGGIAACGKVDTQMAARNGMNNLMDAKSASFVMRLDDPAGELAAWAKANGDESDAKDAKALTGLTLHVVVDPAGDKAIGDVAKTPVPQSTDGAAVAEALKAAGSMAVELDKGDKTLAGLRLIDGVAYLKLDESGLAELSGETPDALDEEILPDGGLISGAGELGKTLKAGKWLKVDVPALIKDSGLDSMLGGDTKASPKPSINPAELAKLGLALRSALESKVESVKKVEGDNVRVDLTMQTKAALIAALDVLADPANSKLLTQALGGSAEMMDVPSMLDEARDSMKDMSDVPMKASALVQDEHLTQLRVQLAGVLGLDKETKADSLKTAAAVIDIDDTADGVSAPPAADVVDSTAAVSKLLTGVTGGAGMDALGGPTAFLNDAVASGAIKAGPPVTLSPADLTAFARLMQMSEAQARELLASGAMSEDLVRKALNTDS